MSHGFDFANAKSKFKTETSLDVSNPCDNNYSDTVSSDNFDFLFDETNKPT